MPHIHTEPGQHDITASAYIIRLDGAQPTLLLHRHRRLNQWLQFGGHIELDENPWSTIVHEVAEESGYDMDQLKVLQPELRLETVTNAILHPQPVAVLTFQFGDTTHRHTDIVYAFVTNEPPVGSIAEGESTDTNMFTADELAALPAGDIPENAREVGLFILEKCLAAWSPVAAVDFAR